jgi:hypothetical protein
MIIIIYIILLLPTIFLVKYINNKQISLGNKYNEEAVKIVKNIFIVKPIQNKNKNELCIHIRSGDIFNKKDEDISHDSYIQPPLVFYRKIILSKDWEKIKIIAEDTLNPCINAIISEFNKKYKIEFNVRKLEEDVLDIISCHNIVYGTGTFVPCLLLLNDNNPQKYTFNDDKYINNMVRCKKFKEQKKIMLTYTY